MAEVEGRSRHHHHRHVDHPGHGERDHHFYIGKPQHLAPVRVMT
jgi:hypothetical protein